MRFCLLFLRLMTKYGRVSGISIEGHLSIKNAHGTFGSVPRESTRHDLQLTEAHIKKIQPAHFQFSLRSGQSLPR